MPKESFIEHRFSKDSQELITHANAIIDEYTADGFVLTLRQLYYQMVARDIIPNKVQSYKRLGSILNDARYAGLVDWSALTDRTRNLKGLSHWSDPSDIIRSAAYSFALDKWGGQYYRPEIWVEKEALAGIVERAATSNDVSFISCRGYMSASEMYDAAQRIRTRKRRESQDTLIIYLGDHDPSGLDMSEGDIPKRFEIFFDKWNRESFLTHRCFKIKRVALNWDQIEQYQPPPNPAKETDSRFAVYQEQFGDESWELDALDPNTLLAIIQGAIDEVKDADLFKEIEDRQESQRRVLSKASERWNDVADFLNNGHVQ
jgi:hypothetical protein